MTFLKIKAECICPFSASFSFPISPWPPTRLLPAPLTRFLLLQMKSSPSNEDESGNTMEGKRRPSDRGKEDEKEGSGGEGDRGVSKALGHGKDSRRGRDGAGEGRG